MSNITPRQRVWQAIRHEEPDRVPWHLGCTVPWDEKTKTFPCPCHASSFDMQGSVLSPPAPRALDLFPVTIEGGIVKVDTSRRIERPRFEPGQVTYL